MMVWALSYRPKPDSYPNAELVEGTRLLMLEDTTPDGGTGITRVPHAGQNNSGRRVKPESVPKVIRWMSKRPLCDYETSFVKTVSAGFRALIEEIEPGVHQFEPLAFVAKDGSPLADRWFWQVCNRLDGMHRDRSGWIFDQFVWKPAGRTGPLVVDLTKVGTAKFWHDKHVVGGGPYITDDAKDRIEAAEMTGVHFFHFDQA